MKRLLGLMLVLGMVGCGQEENAGNAVDPSVFADKLADNVVDEVADEQLVTKAVEGKEISSQSTADAVTLYILLGVLLLGGLMVLGFALLLFNMPKPGELMNRAGIAGVMLITLLVAALLVGGFGIAIYNQSNNWDRGVLIGLLAIVTVLGVMAVIIQQKLDRPTVRTAETVSLMETGARMENPEYQDAFAFCKLQENCSALSHLSDGIRRAKLAKTVLPILIMALPLILVVAYVTLPLASLLPIGIAVAVAVFKGIRSGLEIREQGKHCRELFEELGGEEALGQCLKQFEEAGGEHALLRVLEKVMLEDTDKEAQLTLTSDQITEALELRVGEWDYSDGETLTGRWEETGLAIEIIGQESCEDNHYRQTVEYDPKTNHFVDTLLPEDEDSVTRYNHWDPETKTLTIRDVASPDYGWTLAMRKTSTDSVSCIFCEIVNEQVVSHETSTGVRTPRTP